MVIILIIIGALFFLAGAVSGLVSVFCGSRLQYLLYREHGEIFGKLAVRNAGPEGMEEGSIVNSGSLWKYIKSTEDDGVPEILGHKNRIKRFFLLFSIFCLIGVASFFAAIVVLVAS